MIDYIIVGLICGLTGFVIGLFAGIYCFLKDHTFCDHCHEETCTVCKRCKNPTCPHYGCQGSLLKMYDCKELLKQKNKEGTEHV